jgi:hypothetical protein
LSARHGAVVGLTLVAIAILSGMGLPSEAGLLEQIQPQVIATEVEAILSPVALQEEIPADVMAALDAETSPGGLYGETLFEDIEVASAMSSLALPEILVKSAVLAQRSCSEVYIDFTVDPVAGPGPLMVNLTNATVLEDNNVVFADISQIDWTITSPTGVELILTQPYDSSLLPEEQIFPAGPFLEIGFHSIGMSVTLARTSRS